MHTQNADCFKLCMLQTSRVGRRTTLLTSEGCNMFMRHKLASGVVEVLLMVQRA